MRYPAGSSFALYVVLLGFCVAPCVGQQDGSRETGPAAEAVIAPASRPTQPPQARKEGSLDLSDEEKGLVKTYVPDEQDQNKIADLHRLLDDRARLVAQHAETGDIENRDALILLLMSTVEPPMRERIVKALDRVWDSDLDYYDLLLNVYDHLDRYKTWLGSARYNVLVPQRDFYREYQTKFAAWRNAQPPRPRGPKEILVDAPDYAAGPAANGPAQPSFDIVDTAAASNAQGRVQHRISGIGLAARPYWPAMRERSSSPDQTIINPNTRIEKGSSTVTPGRIYRP